jgi:hypothetical protein
MSQRQKESPSWRSWSGLRDWLDEHGMQTVGHLRSQRSVRDPAAWERANYNPRHLPFTWWG